MSRASFLILLSILSVPAASYAQNSPFVGRWDFNVTTPKGPAANWLGITQKGSDLDIWFQPTGGHVVQIKNYTVKNSRLTFPISKASHGHPAATWELEARDGKLVGTQKGGANTIQLTGVRAPALHRNPPKAWSSPVALFNGRNLDGWEPVGNTSQNHWVVKNGVLLNEAHGANLKTTRKFEDFKLHFEVNCPENSNSGFYMRGRYELQLAYEPVGSEPPERDMGSIYGRLAPQVQLPRTPGQWESFDVTLVGRTITVVRDGKMTIDHREIEGITGGALDANEGEPGVFYIQGDHTGGLQFRNITVAEPQKR